ncbi:MAG TPA: BON domain-containing protein [Chitinispirillaceae bacterium]|nr:BON domain-containing protein [Chitinispirillaceae bacterium]
MPRSNSDIKGDILDNLARDTRLQSEKIKLEISGGLVVITGNVQSYQAREAVESDVWAVSGVSTVDNRLDIVFPPEFKRPSDEAILESVKRLLAWDPDIFLERIDAFVHEGRVILEGSVDRLWKKYRAEKLVRDAGGVMVVVNKLVVIPSGEYSDERIGQDIISILNRNSILDVNSISVEVQKGLVRLIGAVPSRTAFDVAEDIARYTQGVVNVDNQLVISAEKSSLS